MASKVWSDLAKRNALVGYFDLILRGASQVFFQNNPLTGLIMLAAIFWGASSAGNLNVAFGAVVGLIVSTFMAIWLNVDRTSLEQGLFGFNGILIGVAVATFLANHPLMWAYLIIGGCRFDGRHISGSQCCQDLGCAGLDSTVRVYNVAAVTWGILIYECFGCRDGTTGAPCCGECQQHANLIAYSALSVRTFRRSI